MHGLCQYLLLILGHSFVNLVFPGDLVDTVPEQLLDGEVGLCDSSVDGGGLFQNAHIVLGLVFNNGCVVQDTTTLALQGPRLA